MTDEKKGYNLILATISTTILWIMLSVIFDFYYDLNDDILIKDIISGAYTGVADAHNNQMMYPISVVFVGLYKLIPTIPWFGMAEVVIFAICYAVIAYRILGCIKENWQKIVCVIVQVIFFIATYLWELTMVQYTVVAGILCATASTYVYTEKEDKLRHYIPAMIMAILAFNIRSEMFLLMCPFMAAAGICRWIEEPTVEEGDSGIICKKTLIKYFGVIGVILAGVLITYGIDKKAYSDYSWQQFREFFDARTEVYDFTGIPDYDANEAFYIENEIAREQYNLLVNYNFDLDEDIDADMLNTIAEYVKSGQAVRPDGSSMLASSRTVKSAIGEYIRGIIKIDVGSGSNVATPFADESRQLVPFNIIVIILYIALIAVTVVKREWRLYVKIPLLIVFRSIAWIYVYYRGRMVSRISHPMFLIEIVMLVALLLHESVRMYTYLATILITAICVIMLPSTVRIVTEKQNLRAGINEQIDDIYDYLDHHRQYSYMDVYSSVDYTEKIFRISSDKQFMQLLGGWIDKSPLNEDKLNNSTPIYEVTYEQAKEMAKIKMNLYTKESEEELQWLTDYYMYKNLDSEISYELIETFEGYEDMYLYVVKDENAVKDWE